MNKWIFANKERKFFFLPKIFNSIKKSKRKKKNFFFSFFFFSKCQNKIYLTNINELINAEYNTYIRI